MAAERESSPLLARLRVHGDDLTSSEVRLVRELLARPSDTWSLAAAELAGRVGVHESTVVRFAKKLGYSGYRELRAELRNESASDSQRDFGDRLRRRIKEKDSLARLVADEVRALEELPSHVPQETLQQAARLLSQARRIFVFAQHHATIVAEFFTRRLRRMGFDIVDLRYKGRDLAERASTLSGDDVVLVCASNYQPPGLWPLLKHADTVGAKSIIISDLFGATFRPSPTLLLSGRFGADQYFQTTIVPLVIAYSLVLAIASEDDGRFVGALEDLEHLTTLYENEE